MSIHDLSHETVEELCAALEKVPTLDWKVLMRSRRFRSVYSEDHVAKIESKGVHPAKVLLDDMTHREITLQDLVTGLKDIGNNKAVSLIMKGAEKSGLDIQYSGGRPPTRLTGQPQEHSSFSRTQPIQRRGQSETLRLPVQESLRLPAQESVATEGAGHPSNPGLVTLTYMYLVETVVSLKNTFCLN